MSPDFDKSPNHPRNRSELNRPRCQQCGSLIKHGYITHVGSEGMFSVCLGCKQPVKKKRAPQRGSDYPVEGNLETRLRLRLAGQFIGYEKQDEELVAEVERLRAELDELREPPDNEFCEVCGLRLPVELLVFRKCQRCCGRSEERQECADRALFAAGGCQCMKSSNDSPHGCRVPEHPQTDKRYCWCDPCSIYDAIMGEE